MFLFHVDTFCIILWSMKNSSQCANFKCVVHMHWTGEEFAILHYSNAKQLRTVIMRDVCLIDLIVFMHFFFREDFTFILAHVSCHKCMYKLSARRRTKNLSFLLKFHHVLEVSMWESEWWGVRWQGTWIKSHMDSHCLRNRKWKFSLCRSLTMQ